MLASKLVAPFFSLLLLVGASGCADVENPVAGTLNVQSREQATLRTSAATGERYIVRFKDGTPNARALATLLAGASGGKVIHVYEHLLQGFAAILPPAAADALRRNPNVAYVEADQVMTTHQYSWENPPNWGLDRIDQRFLPLDNFYNYSQTGYQVNVYIVDTGLRATHGEFSGFARNEFDARPSDFRNGLAYGSDCHGHGTHVGGIAGGAGFGVAKSSSVIGVKVNVECTRDIYPADAVAGLDFIRNQKFHYGYIPMVANLSFGGPTNTTLDAAVNRLITAGVTVVVSAGNGDIYGNAKPACNYSPSRVAAAITVGATTINDVKSSYSNFGSCVDLFAPGDNITSGSAGADDDVATLSGTSQAAPYVTGVAALYLRDNPSATPSAVASYILSNATTGALLSIGTGSPNRMLYNR